MTKKEMESKVAELLLEQKKLKRLNLELPPNKLLLLQRLLYRLGWTNMSRNTKPIKYAKFNNSTAAHPLVHGFPIEHALRHIANSPHSTDDAKNLAVAVLKGHTEALWGLHDELQSSNHPILQAGYKWLNAADKLHLDKHTRRAMEEAAERSRAATPHADHTLHVFSPEYHATAAALGINSHPNSHNGRQYQDMVDRVKELHSQATDNDIKESIRRHAHRSNMVMNELVLGHSPDSQGRALQHPTIDKRPDAYSHQNEMATRYKKNNHTISLKKYSLANKSNFIGALLKASSPEHKMFVQRTRELAKRIGASKTKQFPALHDTPGQSVSGVAMAVYGHIQPNAAHALGSWVNGLLPNGPGYAVFHTRPMGTDRLYRLRMDGSGYDARMKLDRAGISSRVFVPHRKGLDVLIPDKGGRMGNTIQSFAQQQKVPIEMSTGHFSVVGSQDQAQARSTFRNKVVQHESGQTNFQKRRLIKRYASKPSFSKPPVPQFRGSEVGYDPKPKVNSVINHAPENSFGASMDEIYADRRGKGPQPIWDDERIAKRDAKRKKQNNYPIEQEEYHEPAYDKIEEPSPSKLPFKGVPQGSTPFVPGLPDEIKKPIVPKKATGKPKQSRFPSKLASDAFHGDYKNTSKPNHVNDKQWQRIKSWAANHALQHNQKLAKFLGTSTIDAHNILLDAIMQLGSESVKRSKPVTGVANLNGKKIRIKMNKLIDFGGTKHKEPIKRQRDTSKYFNVVNRYSRRRDFILSFSRN